MSNNQSLLSYWREREGEREGERERERQTDRQTDRDRQTDIQTETRRQREIRYEQIQTNGDVKIAVIQLASWLSELPRATSLFLPQAQTNHGSFHKATAGFSNFHWSHHASNFAHRLELNKRTKEKRRSLFCKCCFTSVSGREV